MNQFRGLFLNCGNHFRMAMASGYHGDARGKVKKLIAVLIFDADAAPTLGDQRIRACVAGRDETGVGLNGGACFRSRWSANEFWSVLRVQLLLRHKTLSSTGSVVVVCR